MVVFRFLMGFVLSFVGFSFAEIFVMPDFKDTRDNQIYKTVQIGEQRWFAENLRFKIKGSICYENHETNCDMGRLYTWAAAHRLVDWYNSHDAQEIRKGIHDVCPSGFHIPSNNDWKKLKYYVGKKGKSDGVGLSLKGKNRWEVELRLPPGSDEFGFNALPAGERHYTGLFMDRGAAAGFWAANQFDAEGAYFWRLTYDTRTFDMHYDTKETALSIRCVEDNLYAIKEPPPPVKIVKPVVLEVQGKKLQTVHIGSQVWMTENLNIKTEGSFCYENDEKNCEKMGRLYSWNDALKLSSSASQKLVRDSIKKIHRGICPSGFHIPTLYDMERLNAFITDMDDAVGVGVNLKNREGWNAHEDALAGENGWGFSALPAGIKRDSLFENLGFKTAFWTTAEIDSLQALYFSLTYSSDDFSRDSTLKTHALSVRCLMDPPSIDEIYDSTAIVDMRDDNRYKTIQIGEDTWMAENLRYAAEGSFCYEDKLNRCYAYGRLYPWHIAMRLPEDYIATESENGILLEHQGVCPVGYHMPTPKEWSDLITNVKALNKGSVASALKFRDGWVRGGALITEASRFNAIPAGVRYSDGIYGELGTSTYFWEASGGAGLGSGYYNLINAKDELLYAEDFEGLSFSVRCVKNKTVNDALSEN